jgi:hypothetical protein
MEESRAKDLQNHLNCRRGIKLDAGLWGRRLKRMDTYPFLVPAVFKINLMVQSRYTRDTIKYCIAYKTMGGCAVFAAIEYTNSYKHHLLFYRTKAAVFLNLS